jgi:hypothetical protein
MLQQLATLYPVQLLDRRQQSFMLLGGSVNDLCLPAWVSPATTKDDLSIEELSIGSANLSETSSTPSSLLDVEKHPALGNLSPPKTSCLQAAVFLTLVARDRNLILRSVDDWPVSHESHAFSAPDQRPNG